MSLECLRLFKGRWWTTRRHLLGEWPRNRFNPLTVVERRRFTPVEQCVPNQERAMIPAVSHGSVYENPEAFNEPVLAFLARHCRWDWIITADILNC